MYHIIGNNSVCKTCGDNANLLIKLHAVVRSCACT